MEEEKSVQGKKYIAGQLGISGLRRAGGYVYEEFITSLRYPRAHKVYQEMSSNDPVIGAVLFLTEMLIRGTDWSVDKCDSSDEAAEFLKSCMDDMDVSWAATINEILSMIVYGFSFHEVVYKIRRGPKQANSKYRSKYTDGRVGWKRMPIRSQASLDEWEFAEDGDIKAFYQQAWPDQQVTRIPLSRGLLFRTSLSRDNPEGRSMLRNAYRPWYFKKHIEEIEGIGIERDLAGLPMLTAPENMNIWDTDNPNMVQIKADAEALIQSVRRDAEEGILLPHGWVLSLLSTGSSRQFDTTQIINRYDNRIAITLLSDIILMGADKAGSFALADTKTTLLAAALEAQIKNIADVFNKYAVPRLFAMNTFDDVDLPKIVAGEIETPTLKELALILRAMGLDISKDKELMNYIRKVASMPQMDDTLFNEVYAVDPEPKVKTEGDNDQKTTRDDTAERDFEQNDQSYTGQ